MNKRETTLSKNWLDMLRVQLRESGKRILLTKIHGHAEQDKMVDHIGCFGGTFIAIEFKVDDEDLTDYQYDYLLSVSRNEGLGMVIRFVGNKVYVTYYTHMMEKSIEYEITFPPLSILIEGLEALAPF